MGAVQDDYVLGVGDELSVTFTGQKSGQETVKVDTSGAIILDDLPPIPAMGRTLDSVIKALNTHLSGLHDTQAYITLSKVRQIGVLVVGNVQKPGRKTLNVFNSILDALNAAGGIQKDGSLRQIKLVRRGTSTIIDLYSLLIDGAPQSDLRLRDGDRIVIPPIGPTIAVAGSVKRAGIYEIKRKIRGVNIHTKNNSQTLTLNDVLNFSGGVLTQGQHRYISITPTADGQERVEEITDHFTKVFSDGTILSVTSAEGKRSGKIELTGHVTQAGLYDLKRYKTLTSILHSDSILGHDIYPLIGIIKRWNSEQLSHEFIKFPIRLVLNNEFDTSLKDGDEIILLNNDYITSIYDKKIKNTARSESTSNLAQNDEGIQGHDLELESFLKENSVHIRGAVRRANSYPISSGITLDNVLAVAGGMTLNADAQNIEITSKSNDHSQRKRTTINLNDKDASYIELSPGDSIRINQKFKKSENKTILIAGEVTRPGEYSLLSGDTVSTLIERAGGMTEQAYPAGGIFSRESERRAEEMRFREAAQDMQRRLAAAVERDEKAPNAGQIEMVRALADELAEIEAVGRITVEANPAILRVKPELDMLLEGGDRLYIPKRPLTVRVSGEVLSPSNLQFRKDKSPLDYIHEAGSFTYHADKKRAFVLILMAAHSPLRSAHGTIKQP